MEEWTYICGDFWEEDDPFPAAFVREGTRETYPRGSFLQRQGVPSSKVFLLLDGCVENGFLLPDGRRRVNLLYTGRVLLGLLSLDRDRGASGVSIRCLTPVTAAWVESGRVLEWPPDLLLPMAMCQTRKMQIVYRQLRQRFFLTAEEQLLQILAEAEAAGMPARCRGARFRPSLLAELLGVSRVHLATVLARVQAGDRLTPGQREALTMLQEVNRNG